MRRTRRAVLLALFSLTACGSKDDAKSSDLALPVTAPMHARERLLQDLKKQKNAAREREDRFDRIVDQNR